MILYIFFLDENILIYLKNQTNKNQTIMIDNKEQYEFKFYEWEKKNKDKPLLRQPFGDKWEENSLVKL